MRMKPILEESNESWKPKMKRPRLTSFVGFSTFGNYFFEAIFDSCVLYSLSRRQVFL